MFFIYLCSSSTSLLWAGVLFLFFARLRFVLLVCCGERERERRVGGRGTFFFRSENIQYELEKREEREGVRIWDVGRLLLEVTQ